MNSKIHRVSIAGKRRIFSRVKAALAASVGLSKPDVVIGAGHATHLSILWLAKKHQARSVVLMKPSLPMAWFDLCIAPDHDFPKGNTKDNLILTRGALNRVRPSGHVTKSGKMILVGGPSSNHGWNGESLLESLREICADGNWQVADSRRTPEGFLDQVRRVLPEVVVFPHQETVSGWLPEKLAISEQVWVTEDSVSMIYEALTSGAKVGLLPAPRLSESSRVLRGLEDLVKAGFLTTFTEWQATHHLTPPPERLREADRCAEELLQRLGL